MSALCSEIDLRRREFDQPIELQTLYIGGGTPTTLLPAAIEQLFIKLREAFRFHTDAEITFEANPESASNEKLESLFRAGVNRLSFGLQSFDDAKLRQLGRIHDAKTAISAVDRAKSCGFENISIDLIYAVPDETNKSLKTDLEQAIALRPQHISFYALTLEGKVSLRRLVAEGKLKLPADDLIAARYLESVDSLYRAGLRQYEISNFAVPGYECRHNLNYWNGRDYLAFGPAAVSTVATQRIKNNADLDGYISSLLDGKLPSCDIETIDQGKKLIETIFLSLRQKCGLDISHLKKQYGYDIAAKRAKLISSLREAGNLYPDENFLRLTPVGMLRADLISSALLPDFI